MDLWGQVRRTIESSRENAQASAADLENVGLSLHSELAFDYFSLRGLDLQKQLLDATVVDYEKALQLTQARYHGGVASDVDVSQAETQLETTRAQDIEVGVARAQFEHAIAVLTGQPASTFSISVAADSRAPSGSVRRSVGAPRAAPRHRSSRARELPPPTRRLALPSRRIIRRSRSQPRVVLRSTAIGALFEGPSALWSFGGSALRP